ncbi:MAG: hypothetical protein Greene041662_477 [Candidatus Peregrinibacteria bacterium Greene0416_62]|nr:MAG: hypothetical protein Greene041662_477 [Candidatus Peregrinibacteria bacterium Greene0416_62]TSC97812.1 MAG: hypothetical protein Greene101449_1080 [Candidatus Peregrinibacteria bacterium Greene1014_49]
MSILHSVLRAWILKPAIILFCLFHMTAVASYSVSTAWNIPPLTFVQEMTLPWVRGYLLATSQWQQWNLFSPDPLRRVSRYRLAWEVEGMLQEAPWIDEELSYHRKANLTKTLRRLEDQGHNAPMLLRFLALACHERALPPGTMIRLERAYYILPYAEKPLSLSDWRNYIPEWTTDTMAERPCPDHL